MCEMDVKAVPNIMIVRLFLPFDFYLALWAAGRGQRAGREFWLGRRQIQRSMGQVVGIFWQILLDMRIMSTQAQIGGIEKYEFS